MRVAVLGSTRGTHLETLVNAVKQKKIQIEIAAVVSNKKEAYILERARTYHLPDFFIDPKNVSREAYDRQVSELLKEKKIDLIILIGYMRILSAEFVKTWEHKIINVHPSLLPAFAGKMDVDVHSAVLESGVSETGCTVHYVTAEVDAGPILLQKKCVVFSDDTVDKLKARVQELEKLALVEAVARFLK